MNPKDYSWQDWINLFIFVIPLVSGATWWAQYAAPETVAMVNGLAATIVAVMNFMLGRKPDAEAEPPAA